MLQDYRSMSGNFDAIYSLGMFEHVGVRNYRTYLKKARELLRPDGLVPPPPPSAAIALRVATDRGSRNTSSPTGRSRRWRR